MTVLGLRLGGTNTSGFVIPDAKDELIPVVFDDGGELLPTAVGTTQCGRIVTGRDALNLQLSNPSAVHVGFLLKLGEHEVEVGPSPIEMTMRIVEVVRVAAERTAGAEVRRCALSVPAIFSRVQISALREAVESAGLQVLGVITDPIAAVLGAGISEHISSAMIVRMGGHSLDISILSKRGLNWQLVSVQRDPFLGGCALDQAVADWFLKHQSNALAEEIRDDDRQRLRLLRSAEEVKCRLSSCESAWMAPAGSGTLEPHEIARNDFEDLASPLFEKAVDNVTQCIANASMELGCGVDTILLTGGSARIPLFRRMIETRLGRDGTVTVTETVNPQLLCANGAAMAAVHLRENVEALRRALARELSEAREMLGQLRSLDSTQAEFLGFFIDSCERDAAYCRVDAAVLNDILTRLKETRERIHAETVCDASPSLPDPQQMAWMLRIHIDKFARSICSGDLERDAMEQALRALDQARRDVERVDVNSPDAMQLYFEIHSRLDRLLAEARLCMADSEGADGLAGSGSGRSSVHVSHPESAEHDERRKTTVMPCPVTDLVHFSITSPPVVTGNQTYIMDAWAHLECQRQEVIQRAKEEAAGKDIRIKSRGPVKLSRGNVLAVRPHIAGFTIDPPQDTIAWEGEIGNVQFNVIVPGEACVGDHPGICDFHVNGLKIASLRFMVTVGTTASERESLPVQEKRAKRVFASYASEDRDAVLARIHGLLKGVPDLDVFIDVASLRSGQRWRERLREEISTRDILYLFWSQAASESEWVDWEWRCAYNQKGIEFIDPVPLVSPNVVPPPRELADLHFNDWVLAYMRTEGNPGHGGTSPPPETHDKGQT